eukprot:Skav233637  [mRNA]  locus=scaffold2779:180403:185637:- [translate_table: standard]
MGLTGRNQSRHTAKGPRVSDVAVALGRVMPILFDASYRLSPLHATRVGEASHPGPVPEPQELTILVTNPTSLHQKVDIMSAYEATILMLSETSATSLVQSQFARSFRTKGYSTVWGQPAPRQQHREGVEDGLRGAPTGVSVHAKFPIRPSNLNRATDWYLSGRILHCFLQVGTMTIQLVTVYGIPSCHSGSRAETNALLEEAISFVRQANYPWIIAGDLNHHPSQLPAFESLRATGCCTAAQIFEQQEGSEIPHTFKTATRNDIAILAPELASHVTKVWVDQNKWLPGHNPLLFKLKCPTEVPSSSYWPLPSSWLLYDVDPQAIARHFDQITDPIGDTDPLHHWSMKVELAVDMAMQERAAQSPAQYPQTHLPRKCKGRCQNFKTKTVPHTRLIKPAWHDQYTPDVDQPSLQLRQQTRQLRRLQSLRARLRKLPLGTFTKDLGQEWKAILRADGFGTGFLHWLKHRTDLAQVPLFIPWVPYLDRVISEVQPLVTSGVTQHATKRKQFAQYLREADIRRYHKKDAYSELREPSPGLLAQAKVDRAFAFQRLTEPQHGLCQLQVTEASALELHLPCTLTGCSEEDALQIISVQDGIAKMPDTVTRSLASIPECFFTDGTCLFPTDSRHRRAGYAILAPKGPLEALADIQTFDLATLNQHFDTIALGHQRGSQTVDRSELEAAITAHEFESGSPVVTDSQYVVDTGNLIRATPHLRMLHKKPHFDLLKRWHFLVWDLQLLTPTQKIKAHQPLHGCAGHERALRVGNYFADLAVKHRVKQLHREYQDLLNQMADEFHCSQRHYRQQLQLRSDLAAFRKQLEKSKPEAILNRHAANHRRLLHWTCPDGYRFELSESELAEVCHSSRYGVRYTELILRWLQQLRWPTTDDPDQSDPGITWIELVFNFWLVAQQVILMPFDRADGTWYLDYTQVQGWTCDQTTFEDMIHQFQQTVQHVESLTSERLLPQRTRQLIGSLYQLGSGTFKRGFLRRPDMPEAEVTVQLVQDYVHSNLHHGKTVFTCLPTIPEKPPLVFSVFEEPEGDTPSERQRRFQLRRSTLRGRRRSAALST